MYPNAEVHAHCDCSWLSRLTAEDAERWRLGLGDEMLKASDDVLSEFEESANAERSDDSCPLDACHVFLLDLFSSFCDFLLISPLVYLSTSRHTTQSVELLKFVECREILHSLTAASTRVLA